MTCRSLLFAGTAGLLCVTLASFGQDSRSSAESIPNNVEFNRDIRPILSDKCYTCHGPSKQMGTLRFDREEVAKQPLSQGRFAIVPGDPAKSQILQRVTAANPAV